MNIATVTYNFTDNKGKRSATRMRFPAAAIGDGGSGTIAHTIALALVNLSSARMVDYAISSLILNGASAPAGPESDCFRRLSILYRNGGLASSVYLPSYRRTLPFDGDGPYRDVRITRSNAILHGVLADIEAIVSGVSGPGGEPHPTTFAVAGAAAGGN